MAVTLKPTVFIMRCGKHHECYGDPYEFSATITVIGEDAYINGASGVWDNCNKDLVNKLKDFGVKRILFERLEDGSFKTSCYNIK